MRGVDHLHKSGRVLGARQRSPPFYQKLRQHSGFVENVCLSMKTDRCSNANIKQTLFVEMSVLV